MPLDQTSTLSAIANPQTTQIANPLDMAVRAMTLKNLATQQQSNQIKLNQEQQQYTDQQSIRDAYKANTSIDQNGNLNFDRAGFMSDLTKANPMLAQQVNFQQLKQQQEIRQQASAMVDTSPGTSLDQKQQQYTAARNLMIRSGLPGADQSPIDYPGDQWMNSAKLTTQGIGEQIAYQEKMMDLKRQQQEANAKTLEANARAYEAGLPVSAAGSASATQNQGMASSPSGAASSSAPSFSPPPKMQAEAMKAYLQTTESSRQRPDAVQALKDIQSADKINELAMQAPKGDLNNLNNNQLRMLATEVSKAAGGGAPTEGALEDLTPDTLVQKYGSMLQNLTGKSEPANAADFIRQYQDYANGMAKQGMDRLTSRSNDVADALRPQLGEKQYGLVKNQIANEFKNNNSLTWKILRLKELQAKAAGG